MRCIIGRGVETISDAWILYFDCSGFDEDGYDWDDLIQNTIGTLLYKYRSLTKCKNKWVPYPYRENKILLENDHVQISISEYCGCGAVSIFNRDKFDTIEHYHLAEHWLNQNAENILKVVEQYVTPLRKLGTFSNGCSVFKKK